jgi:rRNA maturation endonuclease Nob1
VRASAIVSSALDMLALECLDMRLSHEKLASPRPKKADSQCLICSKIFYNEVVDKCTKCGGVCVVYNDGLTSSGRHNDDRSGW